MKTNPVTVAEASDTYDHEKPGAGHRVTLPLIARRFGIKPHDLWNFRRGLSPDFATPSLTGEKEIPVLAPTKEEDKA